VLLAHFNDFLREETLSELIAEILSKTLGSDDEFVLKMFKNVGTLVYSDKDLKLSKSTAKFLCKFSEVNPKETLKQIVNWNSLFDSESYNIRSAMMDVIGNVIHGFLAKDDSEVSTSNINVYYEKLLERLLDTNSFVRAKVLKILAKLTQYFLLIRRYEDQPCNNDIPKDFRQRFISSTILRLRDKGSLVRRRAIELMIELLKNHPFILIPDDKDSLSLTHFEKQNKTLVEIIQQRYPEDAIENDDEELQKLKALLFYYHDAILFSKSMNEACIVVSELLQSTLKTEVIAAMKFFVVAHRFELENSTQGVKKMVHKIWVKDTDDKESGTIGDILQNSFYTMHMDPPDTEDDLDAVIAHNMIKLVQSMDLAEKTSLEELLGTMAVKDKIAVNLPKTLWNIFSMFLLI
jgi:condensin complex subunit 1